MESRSKTGKLDHKHRTAGPNASASGKTLVVATTQGNMVTPSVINGKNVVIGLNAYIKK